MEIKYVSGIIVKCGFNSRLHHLCQQFPCLQNVHSAIRFVFKDHNFCMESGVRLFQALFYT